MKTSLQKFWLIIGMLFLVLPEFALAQTGKEVLSFSAGEVFEITAYTEFINPRYSWVLTKDTELRQASQGNTFSIRLSEPGNYVLKGSVLSPETNREVQRFFFIRVTEPNAPSAVAENIQISPPLNEYNALVLNESSELFVVKPSSQLPKQYIIDLDADNDTNNDGIPSNDQYAGGTLFSQNGTPLYVWIPNLKKNHIAIQSSDNVQSLKFFVFTPEEYSVYAAEQKKLEEQNPAIVISRFSPTQFGFSVDPTNKSWKDTPVLFLWNFSDGIESIHDTPIRTFTSEELEKVIDIRVQVRSLESGEIIDNLASKITLQALSVVNSSSSAESSQESLSSQQSNSSISSSIPVVSSSQTSGTTEEDSGGMGLIIQLLLVAFGSIFLGFITVFIIHMIKKIGGVQGMINKSEEKLLPQTPNNVVEAMPLPEVIEANTVSSPNEAEVISKTENTTPSWLQPSATEESNDGIHINENASVIMQSGASAVPAWLQTSDSTKEIETVTTQVPELEPAKTSTPDWLQTAPVENATVADLPTVPAWLQTSESSKTTASSDAQALKTTPQSTNAESLRAENSVATNSATVPAWLQTSESVNEKGIPNLSTSSSKDTTSPNTEDAIPAWLKTTPTNTTNDADTLKNPEATTAENSLPAWLQSGQQSTTIQNPTELRVLQKTSTDSITPSSDTPNQNATDEDGAKEENATNGTYEIDPAIWATMSEQDREKERKRLKRKRYRANKKQRDTQSVTTNTANGTTSSEQVQVHTEAINADATEPAWLEKSLEDTKEIDDTTSQDLEVEQETKSSDDSIEITLDDENTQAGSANNSKQATSTPEWLQNDLAQQEISGETTATASLAINDVGSASTSTIPSEPAWIAKSLADKKEDDTSAINSNIDSNTSNSDETIEIITDEDGVTKSVEKEVSQKTSSTPAWLQNGLTQAEVRGQTPTSTSPAINDIPLASSPTVPNEPDDIQFIVRAEGIDDDKKS